MNDDFVNLILKKYRENNLSHVYLIETNNIEETYKKIIKICKFLQCPMDYKDECVSCNICNLINNNNHPNVVTIEPDGINIKKEQITNLQYRFLTKPTVSKYNIYIIKGAEYLNESSENSLLKFLEEPADDILGFWITENADKLLSTITSRCQLLVDYYPENKLFDQNVISIGDKYYELMFLNPLKLLLVNKDTSQVINSREMLSDFFIYIYTKYMLEHSQNINYLIIRLIKNILDDIKYNINIELILDKFVVEMSDING